MYLEMKRNAIEKVKGITAGMTFTEEEVVLLSSNLEENAKKYDEQMEDKFWNFKYNDTLRGYMENNFKNLFGIEEMKFDPRKGVYVIEKLIKHHYEAFAELADRQAKAEKDVLNKEFTLEQLFIEELKERKLRFNYEDLLQNCRNLAYKYDIYEKKGKYILKEKE